ncbi:TSL-kinase interacting protein 1 [Cajanus cajan]|uniref:TSL-kinase interacting protein 1 n=1 Tax=Cajanus cajan TaxID=3821 RepID=A0A151QUU0_CAJCA|nr:TSL-kinase interacting protein 1 [Cajanus cajan]KYP34054.1 TSL-kinase interacting protein 1 [Cajanus cajan]
MEVEAQITHDSDTQLQPETVVSVQNGNPGVSSAVANAVNPQQPATKKPTRQWAAWTRQEEESFFTALRQVGKNFEKITSRVQSKNKDQVRHYYYRLVRRMNKLLGPGLCLDAKNSKDTNAAMLRWWSLLEKYSCKASKLHLKPRRFKIFLEALEHQLLKDRKKNVRKRSLQGGNCLSPVPTPVSNQSRASGNDARAVKLVLVDSQNILKLGPSKPSMKRSINMGVNRSNTKGDSNAMKPTRQRKKSGVISTAAYKKWEKAAIAGVSLVADAAEHLERAATVREIEQDQENPGEKCSDPVDYVLPSVPTCPQNQFVDNYVNINMKLKLQLFPIDEPTRKALEMDKHNPHLELTLSTRKKISSILEHLNRKWGNSSIAVGELMLFPYGTQRENLVNYQRWTQESTLSAADIYAMIGTPPIFRLRYGWFSNTELGLLNMQVPVASSCMLRQSKISVDNTEDQIVNSVSAPMLSTNTHSMELSEDCRTSMNKNHTFINASTDLPNTRDNSVYLNTSIEECRDPTANTLWHGKDVTDGAVTSQLEEMDELKLSSGTGLSAGEWADSLTNISVGDLLSGASQDLEDNCINPPSAENCHDVQQIPFSSDSFDAAIAAHISRHQDKMGQPSMASHMSSIWDAEETCDAFLFKKDPILHKDGPCLSSVASLVSEKKVPESSFEKLDELSPDEERLVDDFVQTDPMPIDSCESDSDIQDHLGKGISALADMYWPDSLGPLDLDIPSTKYHSEDLIFSDSLSGLNRLIASSLDAFQNCSFFGFDKKEAPSTVEARESAALSDFKIGSGI